MSVGVFLDGTGWTVRCSRCGKVDYVASRRDSNGDLHETALKIAAEHDLTHTLTVSEERSKVKP